MEEQYLRYGDLILLFSEEREGFVYTEGFTNKQLSLYTAKLDDYCEYFN
jgi:hypothetical protein